MEVMHIGSHMIAHVLKEFDKSQREFLGEVGANEIGDIVINHAIGAAAASAASGWIPGAGGTAALMASVGFIWSMYYRINQRIGISISKNKLKSLASAVVSNIASAAMSLILGILASTVLSFIPGVGNVAASIIMAALDYGVVFAAGIMYLKMLTKLCKEGANLNNLSETDLKNAAKTVIDSEDVSKIIKDAKEEYKTARENGTITGNEEVKLEDDDDGGHENASMQRGTNGDQNKETDDKFNMLIKSAQQGDAVAQVNVGFAYQYGKGTAINTSSAFEWYMKAAQQGHPVAQFNVGVCYRDGTGVTKDPSKAFEWFMKAAQQGEESAQNNVGYAYSNGKGVVQDLSKGFEWYMKAAQQGDDEAQNNVGAAYYNGKGIGKNLALAKHYFELAAAQGCKAAIENLKLVQ
jgi:uncharacterized protein (DUF697 family)